MKKSNIILAVIVLSQFCCTALWFAGNGVMNDLVSTFQLDNSALGNLTSAVQFGFIVGTLGFAVLTIADRFSPSKVFFICALLGAIFNLGLIWDKNGLASLLCLRFVTGFFLAGIYPVGMKIAADYFDQGLGKSLGYLVGALVVGTAFPHLLKDMTGNLPWKLVLFIITCVACFGGLIMVILVPDGPFRKPSQKTRLLAFIQVFKDDTFRASAFGYFGHMWELYTFWAFVPIMLQAYAKVHPSMNWSIPLLSFCVIGIGGVGCVLGGYMSEILGVKKMASRALLLSGCCCLISPLAFTIPYGNLFLVFLLFWGITVITDSPLFSTMVAQSAPVELKGTALTIVNCIGFSITIVSLQIMTLLKAYTDSNSVYIILTIGPLFGLLALWRISAVSGPNGVL
ncbi:MFS transporter [Aestuariivivens sediminicola]|uniref:MFS transporter n=1 Tax=Aestuariivivens sediminicola TaxID=2913560 RepID=UPI001F59E229|nr:MFS transporter [Aestuariivivens sediminicola]